MVGRTTTAFCSVILYVYLAGTCVHCQTAGPVVTISNGKLRGVRREVIGMKIDAFLGIPYAEPPIGDRRFKVAEELKENWDGIHDATRFGNACWQTITDIGSDLNDFHKWWTTGDTLDEDCLVLNVWTPYPHPGEAPVLVFIHGGSFIAGSSSTQRYRGDILAAYANVVVVNMNYRLGALGFAYFGTEEEHGNLGLTDQILALKWVRQNIETFGGSPNRITLIGHSAGAASVGFHLVSLLSRNLFQKAILQSGTPNTPWAMISKEEGLWASKQLARDVGCPCTDNFNDSNRYTIQDTLSCLRKSTPLALVNANAGRRYILHAVTDGYVLNDNPQTLLANKSVSRNPIPLIIGTVDEEGILNMPFNEFDMDIDIESATKNYKLSDFETVIHHMLPYVNNPSLNDAIAFQYRNWLHPDNSSLLHRSSIELWEDYHMLCPVKEFAKYYSRTGNAVYAYNFNHQYSDGPYPKWMGTLHAEELLFTHGLVLEDNINSSDAEKRLSAALMEYWSNFARTGDPNQRDDFGEMSKLPRWPRHSDKRPVRISLTPDLFDDNDALIGEYGRVTQCAFWSHLVPKLMKNDDLKPGLFPVLIPKTNKPVSKDPQLLLSMCTSGRDTLMANIILLFFSLMLCCLF